MPDLNWNDLRVVLAVFRSGSLAAAARLLHVDETTVARRLAVAEAAVGARLFQRTDGKVLCPTEVGEAAVVAAEQTEQMVGNLHASATQARTVVTGTVRLTAVPILINHLLVPALHDLTERCPVLRLELIAEPRDLILTRREADMALRMARPSGDTGANLLARRVADMHYAPYVSAGLSQEAADRLPWLGYEQGMAALPPARWLAARQGTAGSPVSLNDAEAILQAVLAGLGRSLLPCMIADRHAALTRCDVPGLPKPPTRELWLLTHPDQRGLARIAAVQEWLERTLAQAGRSLAR
jgi:DNA-binding transcriptional LysR family regulator